MAEETRFSGILEEMTIDDVQALKPNVGVVPVGSTEPHGPALPYGTDSFSAEAVSYQATRQAVAGGARVICLPTQRISLNNNFHAFPFACRVSVPTFMNLLKDIVLFLMEEGVRRVIIVNGHGGNTSVVQAVQRDLAKTRGLFLGMVGSYTTAGPETLGIFENRSDHAGEEEASLVMFHRPELVRRDKLTDNPRHYPRVQSLLDYRVDMVRPWHLYIPASAGGDARKASAEKGRKVFESAAQGLARLLSELSAAPDSENFPY